MDNQFHPTFYWAFVYLSMLRSKLIHADKRGPCSYERKIHMTACLGVALQLSISCEIGLKWVSRNPIVHSSILIQVTPWCGQATNEPLPASVLADTYIAMLCQQATMGRLNMGLSKSPLASRIMFDTTSVNISVSNTYHTSTVDSTGQWHHECVWNKFDRKPSSA